MPKPLAVLTGARVEMDGREVLLLRLPFNCESPMHQKALELQLASFAFPFALVSQRPDGTLEVAGNQSWMEKLETKIPPQIQWGKIPIYPHDSLEDLLKSFVRWS